MHRLEVVPFVAAGMAAVLWLFVHEERRGRRETAVIIVFWAVLIEALLYPDQGMVPSKLFYPSLAGQQFRTPEVLIPLALLARWLATTGRRRVSAAALAWAAFFAWYAAELLMGKLFGNPTKTAFFDAKAIIYVGGGYALAAGVPARVLVDRFAKRAWLVVLAVVVTICDVISYVPSAQVSYHLPLVPIAGLSYSADASACVVAIATVVLVVELTRRRPSQWVLVLAFLLVISPLTGTQRASTVEAAVAFAVVVLVSFGRTWRQRVAVLSTDVLKTVALVTGAVVVGLTLLPGHIVTTSVSARLHEVFTGVGKTQSASARRQLWHEAARLISQRPVFGWGLGKQPLLRQVPPLPPVLTPTHDLALDILLRAGAVGLVLFLVALAWSLHQGATAWRRSPDPMIAGLALGAVAAVMGIMAKGVVESVFDQFRVATMLGLALGVIASCARATEDALREAGAVDVGEHFDGGVPALP